MTTTGPEGPIRVLPANFESARTKFNDLVNSVDSALSAFQRDAQLPGSAFPYKATNQPEQYQQDCYARIVKGLTDLRSTYANLATWLDNVAAAYQGTETSIAQSYSEPGQPHG